jgi:hypothetical protein
MNPFPPGVRSPVLSDAVQRQKGLSKRITWFRPFDNKILSQRSKHFHGDQAPQSRVE